MSDHFNRTRSHVEKSMLTAETEAARAIGDTALPERRRRHAPSAGECYIGLAL